jgi:DNA-binding NtrC family response regulator
MNESIETTSAPFRKLLDLVQKIGNSDVAALLQGETGTGQKLVARMIYETRAKGQFVPINCAALRPNLVESELLGHERGASTEGLPARPGLLQAAHGGTAFFEEVGELASEGQAILLRALQRQEIRPVGSNRSHPCRFRIIAATSRNLAEDVKASKFRRDLYLRLNVLTLDIPPLREHKEDIPVLINHFLTKAGSGHSFGPELVEALSAHTWWGGLRELENCVAQLVALSTDGRLHVEDLPAWGMRSLAGQSTASEVAQPPAEDRRPEAVQESEAQGE